MPRRKLRQAAKSLQRNGIRTVSLVGVLMVLAVDIPDEMPDEDSEWFREAACDGVIQF